MLYYPQRTGDGTHYKKRRSRVSVQSIARGRTPIERNIVVVDEQGNTYEATYPKRARGLVKHGRARFIEENVICLACPPNRILEDKTMQNDNTPALTMGYLLGKIDQLTSDTAYLHETIAALQSMAQTNNPGPPGSPGDIAGQAKANALCDVVKCRETTNQQLIALYTTMYKDMRCTGDERLDQLQKIGSMLNRQNGPYLKAIVEAMFSQTADENDEEDDD